MNLHNDPDKLAIARFGIGQPVTRTEDPILVQGQGRYTDDINLPGQVYAVMVRSPHAPRHHPGHRHRGGARDAGRARRLYRRRPDGGRLRHAEMRASNSTTATARR